MYTEEDNFQTRKKLTDSVKFRRVNCPLHSSHVPHTFHTVPTHKRLVNPYLDHTHDWCWLYVMRDERYFRLDSDAEIHW